MEYADLVLILTAVLSACSAFRWPGRRFDRDRFVELLIRFSRPDAHCDYVSLLSLMQAGLISEHDTPWGSVGKFTRILRDDEIDLGFSSAQARFPNIPTLKLKQHTYAALIYDWLRCPYAHEYCMGDITTHLPASKRPARISYIHGSSSHGTATHIASFHLDYLLSLATHHAKSVCDTPDPKPQVWWLKIA